MSTNLDAHTMTVFALFDGQIGRVWRSSPTRTKWWIFVADSAEVIGTLLLADALNGDIFESTTRKVGDPFDLDVRVSASDRAGPLQQGCWVHRRCDFGWTRLNCWSVPAARSMAELN